MVASSQVWSVYMIQSQKTGQIYTGITLAITRRLEEHNAGKGAKFTKGRAPWYLIYAESGWNKGPALKRELELKRLSRTAKLAHAAADLPPATTWSSKIVTKSAGRSRLSRSQVPPESSQKR